MKTKNIKIETRVHTRLKRHAKMNGRIISHLASELIDDGLNLSLPAPGVSPRVKTQTPQAGSKMGRGEGKLKKKGEA